MHALVFISIVECSAQPAARACRMYRLGCGTRIAQSTKYFYFQLNADAECNVIKMN